MVATHAWAVMLEGYLQRPLGWIARGVFGALSLLILFAPTGTASWGFGMAALIAVYAFMAWQQRGSAP
jgi:hypothetical protein